MLKVQIMKSEMARIKCAGQRNDHVWLIAMKAFKKGDSSFHVRRNEM